MKTVYISKFFSTIFGKEKSHTTNQSFFTILVFSAVFVFGINQATYATGPGPAWLYYRQITLSPATPSANFQVKLTLTAGQYAHMNSNGSDLRFYDNTDAACSYWIEGTFNTSGTSYIWVKVATSGATSLTMYYGNVSASAASSGSSTFDFFDDFIGTSFAGNWTTGGSVTLDNSSQGLATLTYTSGTASVTSGFTPSSASYLVELKHKEPSYYRNRFYVTTSSGGGSPVGFDYGLYSNGGLVVYWNGNFSAVTANTDYLMRWQITDGSTYTWTQYTYANYQSGGAAFDTRSTTFATNCRFLAVSCTESAASTILDWARVRKYTATEPAASVGSETSTSCTITGAGNFTGSGTATTVTFSWTRGAGTGGVLIVARLESTTAVVPLSGTAYTAGLNFSTPSSTTGTGNVVVYNDVNTGPITVIGLAANSLYYFDFYEYNTGNCYILSSAAYSGSLKTCQ